MGVVLILHSFGQLLNNHPHVHCIVPGGGLSLDGERWVSLPPIEANLARVLVARFGAVVGREELMSAGWPEGEPARNLLDVRMLRLRRRLLPLDLVIRTIRSRGYLLEHARV